MGSPSVEFREFTAGLAFSADSRRLATTGNRGVARVWDVDTGKELLVLSGHAANVYDVTFSPDGRRIATVAWDQTARVWDASTGREILSLPLPTEQARAISFSADGQFLAVATGADLLLFDAPRGDAPEAPAPSP
jgi:WD40 repeat protein